MTSAGHTPPDRVMFQHPPAETESGQPAGRGHRCPVGPPALVDKLSGPCCALRRPPAVAVST